MRHPSNGWSFKSLGEVASLQRGFDLPVQDRIPGVVPIFAANGTVGTHNVAMAKGPGVVTGRSGTLGEVHLVQSDYWPLNTALWVTDFHGNEPRWVARLLSWMRLEEHTRGTGVPTLNRNLVHAVTVPVPPIPEQRRIADILDKADAIRRKRKEAIALTEALLRSTFLEMFGDPITNPKRWPVMPLGSLLGFLTSGSRGWAQYYAEQGKLFIRIQNVRNDRLDLRDVAYVQPPDSAEARRTAVKGGDVLVSITADLGRTCVIPGDLGSAYISQHLALLRPVGVESPYLSAFLASDGGQRQFARMDRHGVKAGLNFDDLRSISVLMPPASLQREFAEVQRRVRAIQTQQERAAEAADDLFSSLVQRAFAGELT